MVEGYVGRKFRTVFRGRQSMGGEVAFELAEACRLVASRIPAPANAGNLSVRVPEGFLVKGGGIELGEMEPENVVLVHDYGHGSNTLIASGLREPSSESIMHYLIYQRMPGVNAVVHAHDQLALEEQDLDYPVTEREEPYGTPELAEQALDALREGNYVVLRNHGSVVVGGSLQEAVDLMLEVHDKLEK